LLRRGPRWPARATACTTAQRGGHGALLGCPALRTRPRLVRACIATLPHHNDVAPRLSHFSLPAPSPLIAATSSSHACARSPLLPSLRAVSPPLPVHSPTSESPPAAYPNPPRAPSSALLRSVSCESARRSGEPRRRAPATSPVAFPCWRPSEPLPCPLRRRSPCATVYACVRAWLHAGRRKKKEVEETVTGPTHASSHFLSVRFPRMPPAGAHGPLTCMHA
jgi:hypothetical protein